MFVYMNKMTAYSGQYAYMRLACDKKHDLKKSILMKQFRVKFCTSCMLMWFRAKSNKGSSKEDDQEKVKSFQTKQNRME